MSIVVLSELVISVKSIDIRIDQISQCTVSLENKINIPVLKIKRGTETTRMVVLRFVDVANRALIDEHEVKDPHLKIPFTIKIWILCITPYVSVSKHCLGSILEGESFFQQNYLNGKLAA